MSVSAEMILISLVVYSIDLSYSGILPYGPILSLVSHRIHHTKQLRNVSKNLLTRYLVT